MKQIFMEEAIPYIHRLESGELSELLAGTPDMMALWRRFVGAGQGGTADQPAATESA